MAELDKIERSIKNKKRLNNLFVFLMCLIELIILGAIVHIIIQMIKGPDDELYSLIALGVLLIWFGILVAYYAWAVYFYNINMGLTNEDWAEIRERKQYSPEGVDEPTENPNINETLGLPTGTVRGTLALTLMMGGLALTMAALGRDSFIKENTFFVDNFDFFKTAFLMMIAFYFGSKSLEMIGYKSKQIHGTGASQNGTTTTPPIASPGPVPPSADASLAKKILKEGVAQETRPDKENKTHTKNEDFDIPGATG
jgi:hypothetical protein